MSATNKPPAKARPKSGKTALVKKAETPERPWIKYGKSCYPKKRIFLSIDAIGSTRLKSSLAEKGCTPGVWATDFLAFLPEVVVVYKKKLIEVINRHCRGTCTKEECVPRPSEKETSSHHTVNVWKYIGDEVVLMAELACKEYHAPMHVLALAETINHFNHEFAGKPILDDPDNILRFKGTAWVAGFPVANIELDLPGPDKDQTVKDFLGPSMDLGFRLSRFASEDRLIVSASLASLIVNGPALKEPFAYLGEEVTSLPLCTGGFAEAKGVKDGKHPLIWYPVNEKAGDNVLCRTTHDILKNFLRDYLLKNSEVVPFILDDRYADPKYDKEYKKAAKEQKKIPNSPFFPKRASRSTPSAKKTSNPRADLDASNIVKHIQHSNRSK